MRERNAFLLTEWSHHCFANSPSPIFWSMQLTAPIEKQISRNSSDHHLRRGMKSNFSTNLCDRPLFREKNSQVYPGLFRQVGPLALDCLRILFKFLEILCNDSICQCRLKSMYLSRVVANPQTIYIYIYVEIYISSAKFLFSRLYCNKAQGKGWIVGKLLKTH